MISRHHAKFDHRSAFNQPFAAPDGEAVAKPLGLMQSSRFFRTSSNMRKQALRADFLMLITAMIWGSAFVAQRVGMDNIGPFLFTGLRFALGAIVLLPLFCTKAEALLATSHSCSVDCYSEASAWASPSL